MKVWLDDVRLPPDGWVWVKTAKDAILLLQLFPVEFISLDHDLGDDEKFGTGYDVIVWMEEQAATVGFKLPLVEIHSQNPVGIRRMQLGLAAAVQREREFAAS